MSIIFSEYLGAALKNYWIRNNNFNFSLSLLVRKLKWGTAVDVILLTTKGPAKTLAKHYIRVIKYEMRKNKDRDSIGQINLMQRKRATAVFSHKRKIWSRKIII